MSVSSEDIQTITQQLGREPEGVQDIPVRGKDGRPIVIRVKAIVRGKPFPSLYWLTDPILKKEIDKLEASGIIKELENTLLPQNPEFKERLVQDHKSYIQSRLNHLEKEEDTAHIKEEYLQALKDKGIGGLSDYNRVRCLHMHYAHYLAESNCIGEWMEERYSLRAFL
jgi:hypothetical protein